jgi:ATP-dependent Zn protease
MGDMFMINLPIAESPLDLNVRHGGRNYKDKDIPHASLVSCMVAMRRNKKALLKTAFHEAGHAVVSFMLDVPFRSVTIRPDADLLGCVLFQEWPQWAIPDSGRYDERRATEWLTRRTQISLAGQIAETLHAGRRPAKFSHSADDHDVFENAMTICSSEEECSAWLNWLFIRTRSSLAVPDVWCAVEALAEELLKQETISGVEARNIIRVGLHHRR